MLRFFAPLIAPLVGALFVCSLLWAIVMSPHAPAIHLASEDFHLAPKSIHYSFEGPLGRYDNQQLQRGFQVYKEVCSACHSMRLVAFRDLEEIGFSKPEVKAIAKGWATETPSLNPDTGEAATRKSLPSDFIPGPYPNEIAARAGNNNALPPDMSLLAKAREGGPAYIASLVTGYADVPADLKKKFPDFNVPPGLHYNPYFANLNIDAAAARRRRPGDLCRRHPVDEDPDGDRRLGLPDVGRRAQAGKPQAHRHRGRRLSDHRDAAGVRGVPEHLARQEALSVLR